MTLIKKTAGQEVYDLLRDGEDVGDASILEYEQEQLKKIKFEADFEERLNEEKIRIPSNRDFYLELHHLVPLVFWGKKQVFPMVGRLTCPAPTFSQTVYIYYRESGELELLWSIPHLLNCMEIDKNILNLDKDQRKVAEYVLAFKNGTLFKNARKINTDLDTVDKTVVIA